MFLGVFTKQGFYNGYKHAIDDIDDIMNKMSEAEKQIALRIKEELLEKYDQI